MSNITKCKTASGCNRCWGEKFRKYKWPLDYRVSSWESDFKCAFGVREQRRMAKTKVIKICCYTENVRWGTFLKHMPSNRIWKKEMKVKQANPAHQADLPGNLSAGPNLPYKANSLICCSSETSWNSEFRILQADSKKSARETSLWNYFSSEAALNYTFHDTAQLC